MNDAGELDEIIAGRVGLPPMDDEMAPTVAIVDDGDWLEASRAPRVVERLVYAAPSRVSGGRKLCCTPPPSTFNFQMHTIAAPRHHARQLIARDSRSYEPRSPRVLVRPVVGSVYAPMTTVACDSAADYALDDDDEDEAENASSIERSPAIASSSAAAIRAAGSVHERAARNFESLLERKKLATVHPRTRDTESRPRASSSVVGDEESRAACASPAVIVRPLHTTTASAATAATSPSPARLARQASTIAARPAPYSLSSAVIAARPTHRQQTLHDSPSMSPPTSADYKR